MFGCLSFNFSTNVYQKNLENNRVYKNDIEMIKLFGFNNESRSLILTFVKPLKPCITTK